MRRILIAFAAAVFVAWFTPVATEAAVIQCFDPLAPACQPIGQFAWDQSFGDDFFTVFNQSDLTDPPIGAGDFTNVVLTLEGSSVDPCSPSDPPCVLAAVLEAGDQVDTLGAGLFFGSLQADLGFTFMSTPFALSRTSPGSELIYAEVVAPEPASVLLLLSGGIVIRALRRRQN
jgi:hypothetical protein